MSWPAKPKLIAALVLCAAARAADTPPVFRNSTLSIAAAANLVPALDELDRAFNQADPGVVVTATPGSSGSLFAQIENGAPFDVFLSADAAFPKRLARDASADASTLTPFAIGRLVLWSTTPGIRLSAVAAAVRSPQVRKLAVANPVTAPYGRAAEETLANLGLSAEAAPKIVTGENIGQTAQFVETGNAQAGFVALSLVLDPKLPRRGVWVEVPADLYQPIEQDAIVTLRGERNPAAREYLRFLRGPQARTLLERFGYGVP